MFANLTKRFSKSGRRLERSERRFAKAQQQAQIEDIRNQIQIHDLEAPRQQRQLKQSMFGRGLGKSTIHTQGMARLTDMQARQRAALNRQRDLAEKGLSLIKQRARVARRMMPMEFLDDFTGAAAAGLGIASSVDNLWGDDAPKPK